MIQYTGLNNLYVIHNTGQAKQKKILAEQLVSTVYKWVTLAKTNGAHKVTTACNTDLPYTEHSQARKNLLSFHSFPYVHSHYAVLRMETEASWGEFLE